MIPPPRLRKTPGIRLCAALLLAFCLVIFAAIAPALAADTDWSKAQTITLVMSEYKFTPDTLTFQRGVAYRLRLINRGKEMHELDGPQFYAAISVGNPEILVHSGLEVDVEPGKSQDLLFVPLQAGSYAVDCDDHEAFGMTGNFTVQ
jgi:uncharacterized cupredoxin-like copper-binding protein